MIYILVLIAFSISIGVTTIIYSLIKIIGQNKIKNKRLKILNKNDLYNNDFFISQTLSELYIKSFSHFFAFTIGHFSSILLDVYSIILSITSLSMVTLNNISEITQIISLLSTFFIITSVFSRLEERSSRHYIAWKKCENIITNTSELLSNSDDLQTNKNAIYSLISSY